MKKYMFLLCAIALLCSFAGTAHAAAIYNYDGGAGSGTWHDADKTNYAGSGAPDGLLCWAAAASNSLAFTGYYGLQSDGVTPISTADDIFQYFVANWPNNYGNVQYAYDWWFDGVDNDPDDNPLPGSGGFYASQALDATYNIHGGLWGTMPPSITNINDYIVADRGLEIQIEVSAPWGDFLHSLSVWGIDTATQELFVTDSDDGVNALVAYNYYTVGTDVYLSGYSNAYLSSSNARISQAYRLNINDGFTPDSIGCTGPDCPCTGPDCPCTGPDCPPTGVPEPATISLLGAGLIGLAYSRRKLNN